MEEFLEFCITSEHLASVASRVGISPRPLLKQFKHDGNFENLRYYTSGQEGVIFTFTKNGHDYCLKLVRPQSDTGTFLCTCADLR